MVGETDEKVFQVNWMKKSRFLLSKGTYCKMVFQLTIDVDLKLLCGIVGDSIERLADVSTHVHPKIFNASNLIETKYPCAPYYI